MRTFIQPAFNAISHLDLQQLFPEVRETICLETMSRRPKKVFTSAQLSRIQNGKRSVAIRKGFAI